MKTTEIDVNGKLTPVSELSPELQQHLKDADDFYTKLEALEKQAEITGDMTPIRNFLKTHPFNQIK